MSNSNSGIGYLKRIGIDKIGIEVCYQTFNPHINLPFHFLVQKYFFHKLFRAGLCQVCIQSRYSEYLLMVKSSG